MNNRNNNDNMNYRTPAVQILYDVTYNPNRRSTES